MTSNFVFSLLLGVPCNLTGKLADLFQDVYFAKEFPEFRNSVINYFVLLTDEFLLLNHFLFNLREKLVG